MAGMANKEWVIPDIVPVYMKCPYCCGQRVNGSDRTKPIGDCPGCGGRGYVESDYFVFRRDI